MNTFIFPYILEDGSIELFSVNASNPEEAARAFRFSVGPQTEPTIRYITLPRTGTLATGLLLQREVS